MFLLPTIAVTASVFSVSGYNPMAAALTFVVTAYLTYDVKESR